MILTGVAWSGVEYPGLLPSDGASGLGGLVPEAAPGEPFPSHVGRSAEDELVCSGDPFDDFDDDDFDDEFDDDFEEEWDEELPGDADQFEPDEEEDEVEDDAEVEPDFEEDE